MIWWSGSACTPGTAVIAGLRWVRAQATPKTCSTTTYKQLRFSRPQRRKATKRRVVRLQDRRPTGWQLLPRSSPLQAVDSPARNFLLEVIRRYIFRHPSDLVVVLEEFLGEIFVVAVSRRSTD